MARQVDRSLLTAFVAEARAYVPRVLAGMERLEDEALRDREMEEVHRLVHTLKGASSMVGLSALSHVAWLVEETLERIAAGELSRTQAALPLLAQTMQRIDAYLAAVAAGTAEERPFVSEAVVAFRRLRGLAPEGDEAAIEALIGAARPAPALPPAPLADRRAAPRLTGDEVTPELLETFRLEAQDHVSAIARDLAAIGASSDPRTVLQDVRRTVHTLKGAAGMVGFRSIGRLAHRMEDLLGHLYESGSGPTAEALDLLLASSDALEDLLAGTRQGDALGDLFTGYRALLDGKDEPLSPLPGEQPIDVAALEGPPAEKEAGEELEAGPPETAPKPGTPLVRVPIERLDELVRLVSELVIGRSTFEQHLGRLRQQAEELGLSLGRQRRVAQRLETGYEAAALTGVAGVAGAAGVTAPTVLAPLSRGGGAAIGFDELELDRYTELHLLSRELTETTSDLAAFSGALRDTVSDFDGYLNRLGRLTAEVQDKLMRLRMVPLSSLASRLHRTVRVTARDQGKLVDFSIEGDGVSLDKTVLEEMADPLLHLLRNAVAHGIEPPELRRVQGKPEKGRVKVRAYHEGTQVVIQVGDDGGGLVPEALREAAVSGGHVPAEAAAGLSYEELTELIFRPGFSTASEVSEVAGRGIGMDVVREKVRRGKGTIAVDTTPGAGTRFTIRLPMTLAIARVLLVKAHGETYAVPLGAVTKIVRVERDEVERVGQESVLRLDGRAFPVVRLAESLGLASPPDESARRHPVLVLNAGERQFALMVDQLVEGRDVVVKMLGAPLSRVRGVTGATLMGDGRVVLILNPAELTAKAAEPAVGAKSADAARTAGTRPAAATTILVVDDSLSVRHVLSSLVKGAGWSPVPAKDGVEALEVLHRGISPDLILLDIEMPRMDGYELTATLRGDPRYASLPIVMITSRAGEKHRQKAFELGVTDYLVKPFQEDILLALIRRLVPKTRIPKAE